MRELKFDRSFFLCFALLFFSLGFFCYIVETSYANKGLFDFPIFVINALDSLKSGMVYHDENGYGTNLAVYKFPPLLAALIVHGAKCGLTFEDFFTTAFWLHVFSYIGSLFFIILTAISTKKISNRISIVLFSMGLLLCPLLDTNILRLQLDAYVLFMVSISMYCLIKNKNFLSGFFIGLAAALKIYPVIILFCFLALGLVEAIAGAAFGFVLAMIYSAAIIGVDETIHFFVSVLPVLLNDLPAGGGDGSVSFPTLLHKYMFPIYTSSYTHAFSWDSINEQIASGKISIDVMLEKYHELAVIIKILSSVMVFVLTFMAFKIRKAAGHACYAAIYSAFVVFTIAFMQNAFLNYQVVLVAPILVVFAYLLADKTISDDKNWYLLWSITVCFVALWGAVAIDTLQERYNQFPPNTVPAVLHAVLNATESAVGDHTEITLLVRCFAALAFMFSCLYLAAREKRSLL